MRIETKTGVILGAAHITATADDDYVIRVVAAGLDAGGHPQEVTLLLTRNELTCINSAATRKMVRL